MDVPLVIKLGSGNWGKGGLTNSTVIRFPAHNRRPTTSLISSSTSSPTMIRSATFSPAHAGGGMDVGIKDRLGNDLPLTNDHVIGSGSLVAGLAAYGIVC